MGSQTGMGVAVQGVTARGSRYRGPRHGGLGTEVMAWGSQHAATEPPTAASALSDLVATATMLITRCTCLWVTPWLTPERIASDGSVRLSLYLGLFPTHFSDSPRTRLPQHIALLHHQKPGTRLEGNFQISSPCSPQLLRPHPAPSMQCCHRSTRPQHRGHQPEESEQTACSCHL